MDIQKEFEVKEYVYSESSAKTDEKGYPVPALTEKYNFSKGVELEIEGNSVIVFTSL